MEKGRQDKKKREQIFMYNSESNVSEALGKRSESMIKCGPNGNFSKRVGNKFWLFSHARNTFSYREFHFQQKRKKNICKVGGVEEIKNKSAICSIDCQLCHQEETKKKTFFQIVIVFCFVFQEPQ